MEDAQIIALFYARDEGAIRATAEQYGALCRSTALHILGNPQDAEECVNDAYLKLWNAIPPANPQYFSAFLVKTVRNIALDRYDRLHADKRGGSQIPAALDELAESLPSAVDVEEEQMQRETGEMLNRVLDQLSEDARRFFVLRYVYMMPVKDIAQQCGASVSKVKVSLMRTRNTLKKQLSGLEEGGVFCESK